MTAEAWWWGYMVASDLSALAAAVWAVRTGRTPFGDSDLDGPERLACAHLAVCACLLGFALVPLALVGGAVYLLLFADPGAVWRRLRPPEYTLTADVTATNGHMYRLTGPRSGVVEAAYRLACNPVGEVTLPAGVRMARLELEVPPATGTRTPA